MPITVTARLTKARPYGVPAAYFTEDHPQFLHEQPIQRTHRLHHSHGTTQVKARLYGVPAASETEGHQQFFHVQPI